MAGYALRINDRFLDLHAGQEVSFTLEAPLLSDSILPGVLSLPFSIPLSQANKQILGNIDLLDYWEYDTKYACELWMEGNYFRSGTIVINNADIDSANITFSEYDAAAEFEDTSLQDLDFPEYDISNRVSAAQTLLPDIYEDIISRNYDEYEGEKDFVTPTVFNPNANGILENVRNESGVPYFKDGFWQNYFIKGDIDITISGYHFSPYNFNGFPVPEDYNGSTIWFVPNCLSLFLYVNYILKKVFQHIGYEINENLFDRDELNTLIAYSNRAIVAANEMQVAVPYNTWTKFKFYEDVIKVAEFAPGMNISDFLKALKNTFNLLYSTDYSNKTISIRNRSEIIESLEELDITDISHPYTQWSDSKYGSYKALKYAGGQRDERSVDESTFIFKGNTDDINAITGAADKDTYYETASGNTYYRDESKNEWKILCSGGKDAFYDLYLAKKAKTLDMLTDPCYSGQNYAFAPVYTYEDIDLFKTTDDARAFRIVVPKVNYSLTTRQSIVDNLESDNGKTENLILLFYRGMKAGQYDNNVDAVYNQPFEYPYASSDAKEPAFGGIQPDTYKYSLEMFGPKGIYEKFHKSFINFFQKTRQVDFTVTINSFNYEKLFNHKLRIKNASLLCKKITFKASPSQLKPCKAEMYQIMQ